jgi:hypothetical protein
MRKALLILAALFMVAGGIAYAAIPGADGTINGCYKRSDGTLRVIDAEAGATCKPSETAIAWSQTGPPGEDAGPVRIATISQSATIPAATIGGIDVVCPSGMIAVGGGYNFNTPGANIVVWKNVQSSSSARVWEVGFRNDSNNAWLVSAYALCSPDAAVFLG